MDRFGSVEFETACLDFDTTRDINHDIPSGSFTLKEIR